MRKRNIRENRKSKIVRRKISESKKADIDKAVEEIIDDLEYEDFVAPGDDEIYDLTSDRVRSVFREKLEEYPEIEDLSDEEIKKIVDKYYRDFLTVALEVTDRRSLDESKSLKEARAIRQIKNILRNYR